MTFYLIVTILIYVILNAVFCESIYTRNPIAYTKYGSVEGIPVPVHTGQIIDTYLGVPYARPPIGDMRFMVGYAFLVIIRHSL